MKKKAPPTQKTNAEKIKNLFIAFGPIWALFILSFVIIYLTGYFDSLLEIQNRPPLAPNGQLTRLQWITHYSMLGIAYYLIRTQQNASNKITVDTITAVHFLHLLLSSIWPFTLSALSSSIFGIGFLSIMGVTVLYLAYMAKQISVQSVYFILPTIIGRMINFYSLTAIIVLNPDQWNFF